MRSISWLMIKNDGFKIRASYVPFYKNVLQKGIRIYRNQALYFHDYRLYWKVKAEGGRPWIGRSR